MLSFRSTLKSSSVSSIHSCNWRRRRKTRLLQISAVSYQKFIDFALNETKHHAVLVPSPLQEKFGTLNAMDGKTELQMLSFQAPKIRLLRSMYIRNEVMQVLDFAVFPKPEFDVPIFCANFFTNASMNIVVLDLNPLHNTTFHREYKEKYYKGLMPLGLKYAKVSDMLDFMQLLPWGGKLTSESIKFFSPIVIWSKFTSSQDKHDALYSAFMEYYKDPGHGVLKKLIGDTLAKDLLRNFLFSGVNELGSKKFLDYFPEYSCEDGSVSEKRSIIGKSFENRPWDSRGEFVGNNSES
ncbi:hypothetical protein Patl1_29431 [Pistacia atlantica]|uniref:Uncharacterized protein n=1 Tax=Pistacia atlantica TaxID=434234 RepID=A0ACC1AAW0_9ROSI|nr:hypothetical protein Patl1_29431 [Pistacia atlantica]